MLDQVYKRHQVADGLYHLVRLSPAEGHALAFWLAGEKATPGVFTSSDREYAPGHFGLPGEPLLEVAPAEFGEVSRERFAQEVAVRGVRIYERSPLSLKEWRDILPKRLGRLMTCQRSCRATRNSAARPPLRWTCQNPAVPSDTRIPEAVYMAVRRVTGRRPCSALRPPDLGVELSGR